MIDPDGEQVGVLERDKALFLARELGLDLVEVAPQAKSPVTRLMDYGKFKYDQSIQEREERKRRRRNRTDTKEVTFRLNIDDHDLDRKRRRVEEFLADGDKVKVTVRLRGRERNYPERAEEVLQRMLDGMEADYRLDAEPTQAGRTMSMTVAPAA